MRVTFYPVWLWRTYEGVDKTGLHWRERWLGCFLIVTTWRL